MTVNAVLMELCKRRNVTSSESSGNVRHMILEVVEQYSIMCGIHKSTNYDVTLKTFIIYSC